MLLGALNGNVLRNMLAGKHMIRVDDGINKARQDFQDHFILWLILKYKIIPRMNLNSKVYTHGIIYETLGRMGLT